MIHSLIDLYFYPKWVCICSKLGQCFTFMIYFDTIEPYYTVDKLVPTFRRSLYRDHFSIFGLYVVSISQIWSLFYQK